MPYLIEEKPPLDELVHYGIKGMKWKNGRASPTTPKELLLAKMLRDKRAAQSKLSNPKKKTGLNSQFKQGKVNTKAKKVKKKKKEAYSTTMTKDLLAAINQRRIKKLSGR